MRSPTTEKDNAEMLTNPESLRRNWAGNLVFQAAQVSEPTSLEELQHLIRVSSRVKALGTRHSFHDIADTSGMHLSLRRFDEMTLDPVAATVSVGAGVRYGELGAWLHAKGFALKNLASLPHISIVGACATATHGSGLGNHCLSGEVAAVEFVDGRGELVTWTRQSEPQKLAASVVALGALGVVTRVTLDVVPTFSVAQTVYENLPLDSLDRHWEEILGAGYSVSLFTDWRQDRIRQIWVKRKLAQSVETEPPETLFGAVRQQDKLHPLPGHAAEPCTEQMGQPGPWFERLPHFRMDFTPSSGAELQTEYLAPIERGMEALLAVQRLGASISPHLQISEIRTVAADDLWMSMAYERDSLAIHFTWQPHGEAVQRLLPRIEESLAPFGARPHWGKLFSMPRTRLREIYPRFNDFVALVKHCDPERKFRNAFLDRYLLKD
jgi:xylitol oxidase